MSLLQDIRQTVIQYVSSKVVTSISALTPDIGAQINPEEDFNFTLTVKNPNSANDGVPLINIIWYIGVIDDRIGKLYVPKSSVVRTGLGNSYSVLSPDTLVKEMYIYPGDNDVNKTLEIGKTNTMGIKGKSGSKIQGVASTQIQFKIYASIDNTWLVPINNESHTDIEKLLVEG